MSCPTCIISLHAVYGKKLNPVHGARLVAVVSAANDKS
jgi:hypothetical protein